MLYPTNIIPIHQVICVNLAIMPGLSSLSTPPKVTGLKHGWTPWDSHFFGPVRLCVFENDHCTTNIHQLMVV